MPLRKRRNIARARVVGGPIRHHDVQATGDLVLEMRRLAPLRPRDGLDVLRPAPAGFENEPTDARPANVQEFDLPLLERAGLVRHVETLMLRTGHGSYPPYGTGGPHRRPFVDPWRHAHTVPAHPCQSTRSSFGQCNLSIFQPS